MKSDEEIIETARAAQEIRRARDEDAVSSIRRPWPPGQEMIYVLYESRRNVFKIGRTCNLTDRLSAHRGGAIGDLRVLALIACLNPPASKKLEHKLLMECRKWRLPDKKEWFRVTPASHRVLDTIVGRCTHPAWVRWANRRLRDSASKFQTSRQRSRGVGLLG